MFRLDIDVEKTFTDMYSMPSSEKVNEAFKWFKSLNVKDDTKEKAIEMFFDIMKMVEEDIERSKSGV